MKRFALALALFYSAYSVAGPIETHLKGVLDEVSAQSCEKTYKDASDYLDGLKATDYDQEIKKSDAQNVSEMFWNYRMLIQSKLQSFYKSNNLSKECSVSARHILRSLRTGEDLAQDQLRRSAPGTVVFPDDAFAAANSHVRRNKNFSNFHMVNDLKSGDVILSRGNAYTSAAISSLGEFDAQFSHLSLVYRDEHDKVWTVEAHIEVGVFVRTLQEHADDHNFRSMVLRFEDSSLAAKAAKFMFEKAKLASETTGNILYDFGFDPNNNDKLFCSEVVSYAFDQASNGALRVPLFPSRLFERKEEFVRMLEIEVNESFVPADLEVDPRFTVIAEWRDAKKIQNILEKDAVLRAMFRWNDELHYNLIQSSSWKSLLYRDIAWPLRRVPYLKKYFIKKLPLNMTRRLIGYFGVLETVGELLQKQAIVANELSYAQSGFPLMESDLYKILDDYRIKDAAKRKKMHHMFRPRR